MSCSIIVIDSFRRDAKRLLKKYISLKTELEILQQQLLENPRLGTLIHENVYKIRLAVKSKGKGKSGGMRVITHVIDVEIQIEENTTEQSTSIYLVAIYDKSEMENIPESDLKALIAEIQEELGEEEAG